jgi:hypothetical protein
MERRQYPNCGAIFLDIDRQIGFEARLADQQFCTGTSQ